MNSTQNLIDTLNHDDGTQRRQAALQLGAVEGAGIADALLTRLRQEPSSCVREDLTWALVQHRDEIETDLVDMLGSADLGIAKGDLSTDSGDLERLAGRPLTPLADVLRAHLP